MRTEINESALQQLYFPSPLNVFFFGNLNGPSLRGKNVIFLQVIKNESGKENHTLFQKIKLKRGNMI